MIVTLAYIKKTAMKRRWFFRLLLYDKKKPLKPYLPLQQYKDFCQ
jgi:hypothetical protein